jgi:hypothetical protein
LTPIRAAASQADSVAGERACPVSAVRSGARVSIVDEALQMVANGAREGKIGPDVSTSKIPGAILGFPILRGDYGSLAG